ncbi:MAG: Uma2 family endonuclease [Gemmatimonadaceae bacterium]|nr:Uma2 family endonuclease [Gemmatimonadaceae bacterium]
MRSVSHEMTAEQLFGYEVPGKRVELVRGQLLVRELAGLRHGSIGVELAYQLRRHLDDELKAGIVSARRGAVFGPDTGFVLTRGPDTVRAPDVSFVLAERVPDPMPVGFGELAPDLVVEVRSPSDRSGALLAKVGEYLLAGAHLVWVIDPVRRVVTVYRADGSVSELGPADALSGEVLLPGFSLAVRSVLGE